MFDVKLLAAFPTSLGRDLGDFFTPQGKDFWDFFTPLGVDNWCMIVSFSCSCTDEGVSLVEGPNPWLLFAA